MLEDKLIKNQAKVSKFLSIFKNLINQKFSLQRYIDAMKKAR
jgi:hypothetical protein